VRVLAFELLVDIACALVKQKEATCDLDDVSPRKYMAEQFGQLLRKLKTQATEASRVRRVISANPKPTCRAQCWNSTGNRLARIVMNTRLSMPSTISSAVNVKRLAQTSESVSQSMFDFPTRSGLARPPLAPRRR
jgi:hypothetical protein